VRKAAQLLGTRKYTISEAAYLVGLTPHNFSRQFRQIMGTTAKAYLQMLVSGSAVDLSPEEN
jgi:AraC-like DNA-binding protein